MKKILMLAILTQVIIIGCKKQESKTSMQEVSKTKQRDPNTLMTNSCLYWDNDLMDYIFVYETSSGFPAPGVLRSSLSPVTVCYSAGTYDYVDITQLTSNGSALGSVGSKFYRRLNINNHLPIGTIIYCGFYSQFSYSISGGSCSGANCYYVNGLTNLPMIEDINKCTDYNMSNCYQCSFVYQWERQIGAELTSKYDLVIIYNKDCMTDDRINYIQTDPSGIIFKNSSGNYSLDHVFLYNHHFDIGNYIAVIYHISPENNGYSYVPTFYGNNIEFCQPGSVNYSNFISSGTAIMPDYILEPFNAKYDNTAHGLYLSEDAPCDNYKFSENEHPL